MLFALIIISQLCSVSWTSIVSIYTLQDSSVSVNEAVKVWFWIIHTSTSRPCRRNRLQAEGLSGMHQSVNCKWDDPWPGGTCQNDPGGECGVSGSLQQPEPTVPQPRAVYREEQRIRVWLHTLGVRRTALSDRCVFKHCWGFRTFIHMNLEMPGSFSNHVLHIIPFNPKQLTVHYVCSLHVDYSLVHYSLLHCRPLFENQTQKSTDLSFALFWRLCRT